MECPCRFPVILYFIAPTIHNAGFCISSQYLFLVKIFMFTYHCCSSYVKWHFVVILIIYSSLMTSLYSLGECVFLYSLCLQVCLFWVESVDSSDGKAALPVEVLTTALLGQCLILWWATFRKSLSYLSLDKSHNHWQRRESDSYSLLYIRSFSCRYQNT